MYSTLDDLDEETLMMSCAACGNRVLFFRLTNTCIDCVVHELSFSTLKLHVNVIFLKVNMIFATDAVPFFAQVPLWTAFFGKATLTGVALVALVFMYLIVMFMCPIISMQTVLLS